MHPHFAICYHGMTRSTKYVYNTHIENIFNVLTENGATYDTYLHTWRSSHNYVWQKDLPILNDYTEHEFLNPNGGYKLDEQDDFLSSIDINDYYYNGEKEWIFELVRNYLCGAESQKRCFMMCKNSNIKYDYVIFVRPDVFISTKLPYDTIFNKNVFSSNTIVIPDNNWYAGYNDRFAITSFEHAHYYAYRINELANYRKNVKFIVSEEYCKFIIDKYYSLLPVTFHFYLFRPDGSNGG